MCSNDQNPEANADSDLNFCLKQNIKKMPVHKLSMDESNFDYSTFFKPKDSINNKNGYFPSKFKTDN